MGEKRAYKPRKPGGGRKRLKPEYDAGKNLKEQMESAVALYEEDCSLRSIADALTLNPIKVRKLLITAGVYESEVAEKVQATFEEYRETQNYKEAILSTANTLQLSKASVTSYLPYQKGVYFPSTADKEKISVGAERRRRYRAVRKLRSEPTEEHLWETVLLYSGVRFKTYSGLPFSYVGLTSCWLNRKYPNKVINYQGPYYCKDNKGDIKKAAVFDKVLLPLQHKKNMIVATKSVLATNYLKDKGIENVTTIGVGLDLDNLAHSTDAIQTNEFTDTIKNSTFSKKLLYIGVLEERRNIQFLLETFKNVSEKISGAGLVLIGKGKPEYVSMCMRKIKELGIEDKVIYKESLEQKYMPAVYQACDAFLLPTRYEIFGMVLLEAMYYGLPVFTTYNGGSSTLMNESNGVVIDSLDMNEWSNKVVQVLTNENRCREIGENAHRTISEKYTWDVLADRFLEVYKRRLGNG